MEHPKVNCKLSKDKKTVSFKCPWCKRIHTHGYTPNDTMCRVSHCDKSHEFGVEGYELVINLN